MCTLFHQRLPLKSVYIHHTPAGLGMYTCDAVSLLGGCPLLLSHGTADFVVDVRSSEHLHAIASKHCTAVEPLYIVQDAIHCGLFDKGGEDFKQIVGNFIRRCFTGLADVEGIAAVAHDAGDVAVPPVLAEPPLRYRSQRRKDN